MMNVISLAELKKKLEAAKAQSERAKGALNQIMSVLSRDWDCDTIDAAKEKLSVFNKKALHLESELKKKMAKFQETWGDELQRLSS
jgi:hypothetical protein